MCRGGERGQALKPNLEAGSLLGSAEESLPIRRLRLLDDAANKILAQDAKQTYSARHCAGLEDSYYSGRPLLPFATESDRPFADGWTS